MNNIDVSNWIEQYLDVQERTKLAVNIYDDVMSEEEKKEVPFELVESGDKNAIDYVLNNELKIFMKMMQERCMKNQKEYHDFSKSMI